MYNSLDVQLKKHTDLNSLDWCKEEQKCSTTDERLNKTIEVQSKMNVDSVVCCKEQKYLTVNERINTMEQQENMDLDPMMWSKEELKEDLGKKFRLSWILKNLQSPVQNCTLNPPGLRKELSLYNYQKSSLARMLAKEDHPERFIDPLWTPTESSKDPPFFESIRGASFSILFALELTHHSGGILCEEMVSISNCGVAEMYKGCWKDSHNHSIDSTD